MLRYADVIADVEGRRAVAPWLDLAELLERRGGWRFRLIDGWCCWHPIGRRRLMVHAEVRNRRAGFVVYKGHRGDSFTYWTLRSIAEVEHVVDALERGALPPGGCALG